MAQQEKVDHLERKMEARHIQMISLGGVIGTGLFLSSGYTISQAGPIGTIIAYFFGAILVYAVMLCLGELSVAMPYTGSFHVYAKNLLRRPPFLCQTAGEKADQPLTRAPSGAFLFAWESNQIK
jgi:S-methylmethionine transporter